MDLTKVETLLVREGMPFKKNRDGIIVKLGGVTGSARITPNHNTKGYEVTYGEVPLFCVAMIFIVGAVLKFGEQDLWAGLLLAGGIGQLVIMMLTTVKSLYLKQLLRDVRESELQETLSEQNCKA